MDIATHMPEPVPSAVRAPTSDYDTVRRSIEFVSRKWREQPSLERIAAHVGMKPLSLQRLFTRWAGVSPKGFLQALTLDHARAMLADSASILDTSLEVGLSGPGRLHDLFVAHEAMTPGVWKARGEGIEIRYGFHDSPFGRALLMATDHGLAGLAFADPGREQATLAEMKAPLAECRLPRGCRGDRPVCRPRVSPGSLGRRPPASHRHDRHRLRGARLGDAPETADGRRHQLFGDRRPPRQAGRGAGCGRRCRP